MKKYPLIFGSDHAGFALKQYLLKAMAGEDVWDCGAYSEDSVDYPDFAGVVCSKVASMHSMGVLICGSGQGMAMTANRFSGIRAALCVNEEMAELARSHNDANVLCLGARFIEPGPALTILRKFLNTAFSEGRHARRVQKIDRTFWK